MGVHDLRQFFKCHAQGRYTQMTIMRASFLTASSDSLFCSNAAQNIAVNGIASERFPATLLASQGGRSNVPGVQGCSETDRLLLPRDFFLLLVVLVVVAA